MLRAFFFKYDPRICIISRHLLQIADSYNKGRAIVACIFVLWINLLQFHLQPLPPEEEKELKETLQEIIGKGKKVKLEQKVWIIKPC